MFFCRTNPICVSAVVMALVLVLVAPVSAQEEPTADELTLQAEQRFVDGQYDAAVLLLERAYEVEANPNTLYNIARVHEEAGNFEEAVKYYERFVDAPDIDAVNREDATHRAATLRQVMAQQEPKIEPLATETTTEAEPHAAQPTVASETDATPPPNVTTTDRPSPRWRAVGIALAVLGGTTLATGGAIGLLSLRAEDDFESATDLEEARAEADRAQTLAAVADGLFVSGGVLTLTGIVIAIASPPRDRGSRVDVVVDDDVVGLAWSTRF